jgi:hypothetical protein
MMAGLAGVLGTWPRPRKACDIRSPDFRDRRFRSCGCRPVIPGMEANVESHIRNLVAAGRLLPPGRRGRAHLFGKSNMDTSHASQLDGR